EQRGNDQDRDRALLLREQVAWTWLDSEPPSPAKALQVLDEAIRLAAKDRMRDREGRLCETAAHAASPEATAAAEQRQRTLVYLARAEECYQKTKNTEGLARVRRHLAQERRLLAYAQQQHGNRADAETALRAALAEFERSGDRAEAQEAADQLALLLYEQRRWLEAAALWQRYADWLATPEAAVAAAETVANLPRPSAETKRNLAPGPRRAVTLSLLASCYTAAGEADKALAVRQKEAELRAELSDTAGAAAAWQQLALDASVAGRRPLFDKALKFLVDHASDGGSKAMVAALRILPDVLGSDLEAARRAKDELAKELAVLSVGVAELPVERRQGFVQAWAMLGSLQARLGEPGPGLASLEKAAEWSGAAGKAAMLSKIGHLCRLLGRLQQALDAQQKVLELADEAAMYVKPAYLLTTLVDVFEVYQALGNASGAQTVLRRALEVAQQVEAQPQKQADDRKILADFQAMLALRAAMAGQHEQAVQLAQRAQAVYPVGFHDENTATAAMALALARTMVFLQRATEVLRAYTRDPGAPNAAELLAKVERDRSQHRAELLDAVKGAQDEAAMTPLALGVSALQGLAEHDKAQHQELVRILMRARGTALAAGRVSDIPTLSWLVGRSAEAIGDRDRAIAAYRRAIEDEEVVRASLASDIHKAALGESRDQVYASLERLYAQGGQAAEALEVSEQRRARALLDVLATGQLRGRLRNNASSRELQQLAERMQALAAQDQSLDLQLGGAQVARLDAASGRRQVLDTPQSRVRLPALGRESEVQALWRQLAEARRRAAGSSAELTSLVTAPTVRVDELRGMAKQRDAYLLEWSAHDDALWVYVVSPAGRVDGRKVALSAKDMEAKVRALRGALGAAVDRDVGRGAEALGTPEVATGDPAELLAELYRTLVAPVDDLLPHDGKTPVIVAPHRSLLLLPLAALTDSKGRGWGESTALAVVPSLGVLRYTAPKHAAAALGGALVVGNPHMPLWQGRALPQLLGAEREATAVAKSLPGPGVELLTGGKATETRVRKSMQGKRILHLATHGVARDDQPGESFVALAAGDGNDGFLTVGEVLDLPLRADLVVLSACQTGLGKVSGDGVLGLGRAFLYAGTPRVVVSLWSVPDEPTSILMDSFYRGLRAGLAPAEALRAAQAATRAKFPAPTAWAGFELVGEPR
ncbi:MAG: CHAT domain-containing protein, partial [Deltaproteobacteria bacterium]|nr:CHAT domain-containing protein [Deltaproteobacteria bacterium]